MSIRRILQKKINISNQLKLKKDYMLQPYILNQKIAWNPEKNKEFSSNSMW